MVLWDLLGKFPGTDYESFNYEWIIGKLKELKDSVTAAKASEDAAAESAEEAHGNLLAATAQATRAERAATNAANSAESIADVAGQVATNADTIEELDGRVTVTESRIDSLVAHAGDTDDNSELLDMRIAADGKTYPTAGDAVRGQVEILTEQIMGIRENTYDDIDVTYVEDNIGSTPGIRWDIQIEKGKAYTIDITRNDQNNFSNVWVNFSDYNSNIWYQEREFTSATHRQTIIAQDFHDQIRVWMPASYVDEFTFHITSESVVKRMIDSKVVTNMVTPQLFGAKADGVTDDSQAFSNAINSGLPVYVPAGTYKLYSKLTLPSNTVLKGAGEGITILDAALDGYIIETADQAHDVEVCGLTLKGNDRASGIHLVCTSSSGLEKFDVMHHIHDVYIEDTEGIAFMVDTHCRECLIDHVYMYNVYTGLVMLGTDNRITNCTVGGADRNGMQFAGSCNFMSNLKAFVCCRTMADGYAIRFANSYEDIVTNIFAQQNAYNGINMDCYYGTYTNVQSQWNNTENADNTMDINITGIGNNIAANVINGTHGTETTAGITIAATAHDNTIWCQYSNQAASPSATPIVRNDNNNNAVYLNGERNQ